MIAGIGADLRHAARAGAWQRAAAPESRAGREDRSALVRRLARGVTGALWMLAAATLMTPALAAAADIVLRNAWMRPAAAGAKAARVYVDIDSDMAVDLTDATTPFARRVEIVRTGTIGDAATEKVVPAYGVPAGTRTRLAYRGDHLRLVDLTRDAHNGEPVPLVLVFTDAAGRRTEVSVEVTVRGLMSPRPTPAANSR